MECGDEFDAENETTRGSMWVLDQKLDQPMDEEAGRIKNMYREKKFSALLLLRLAFQSLGEIVGALSLIIYSLTLIPLLKYEFIVCKANDNGQGGTLILYSLLCRHAKVKTIPNLHRTDEDLTTYSRSTFHEHSLAGKIKRWLEAHAFRRKALLILVLVGNCMVIGDGILTPAISVLSASGGIMVDHPKMSSDVVVLVSVVILVCLFSVQHYGTDKVGWLFAPIVLLWFVMIGGIGIFNIYKYDSIQSLWTDALFADLAHFPLSAIQIAFTTVVFPCLLLAYSGQAAYLMENKEHVIDAFYRSVPGRTEVDSTFQMKFIDRSCFP
ncbi:hypothetical protein SASPL_117043 [Salvia splendens]|uniref:K+ potassium transporter integral membrane domain-containing protein n=1 Tax=Salvia splendens TaxID=180675 RepID=A0A8X8ZVY2_SALSN|nr:hypothetical protein SASPL_117043 [Salvia splendens]